MLCSSCGCAIEPDQVTWIRGTAVCPACAAKGRQFQRGFLIVWVIVALCILAVPLFLCLGGFHLLRLVGDPFH